MDTFLTINSSVFAATFGEQIEFHLAKYGKFTENGALHGQSIRSACLIPLYAGGREFTVLSLMCAKNGLCPSEVDGKTVDGIMGHTVQFVTDYLRTARPEWFPAKVSPAPKAKVSTSADALAALGL